MLLKLPEKYKGIEKEYKAILEFSAPIFWENSEREKPYIHDMFYKMLDELNNMEIEMTINAKETKVNLQIEKKEHEIFLIINMKINREEYKYDIENEFEEEYRYANLSEIVHIEKIMGEFNQQIQNFIIAVGISYPGLLEISKIVYYINEEYYSSSKKVLSTLLISVTEAMRDNWPKINIIEINKTWKWLKKRDGFMKGMSNNYIERALSAFSYIYDCYSYDDLFYALIGIEAIYVRNKEGILQQIKEKSRAFFGEPMDYMKRLKHMYNVRSRFIHGELNFPPRYFSEEDSEADPKAFIEFADEQYFDSKNLAQAILVASIQQFVLRDVDDIEFELNIIERK